MRKKAKKLLAFLLCLLMLVPTMCLSSFASSIQSSSSGSEPSQPSASDISAILNALSYDEYRENILNKHHIVGNMTFYSQLGEKLGTATVVDRVASVFVYNGNEYSLTKLGKSSYITLGGEYEGSCEVKVDGATYKNKVSVIIDEAKETATIIETVNKTAGGQTTSQETTASPSNSKIP
jgi:hypothetical protein